MVKMFVLLNSLSVCEHKCVCTNTKSYDGFLHMVCTNHASVHTYISIDRIDLINGCVLPA